MKATTISTFHTTTLHRNNSKTPMSNNKLKYSITTQNCCGNQRKFVINSFCTHNFHHNHPFPLPLLLFSAHYHYQHNTAATIPPPQYRRHNTAATISPPLYHHHNITTTISPPQYHHHNITAIISSSLTLFS